MALAKTMLLAFALCLPALASQAQKCNFDKDDVDGFTKERTRSTTIKVGKNSFRWWIQMEQKGSKYFMTFYIFQIKDVHDVMSKGTKVMMKLENETIVALETDKDIAPVQNVEQAGTTPIIVTQWTPRIELTADQVKSLGASPVELIRTSIAGQDVNSPDIKGKQGEKIRNTAACMLQG